MKKTKSLKAQILFFFTIMILVLCTVITMLSLKKSLKVASEIFSLEGTKITEAAKAVIDGDKFEILSNTLDEEDPFYEEIRLKLLNIWSETSAYYLYTIAPSGGGDYLYIIDGSGEAGSETFSAIGDNINVEDYDLPFFRTWETKTRQHTLLEKGEWGYLISVYEPIMNSRGTMVGVIGCDFDAEFLYNSLKSQTIEQILFGVLFAIVGVGVVFLLLRFIFIRLARISEILEVLSKGEGNLSARIKIKHNDEIGRLAGLFNETLDKICEMLIVIKDQTNNLSNVGSELSGNMNATASAVTEITGNIQRIKNQVINQSASVTQTNVAMEQVVDNIRNLNTHVEEQTDTVSQSSSAIEEMLANIQNVTHTLVMNSENVERLISASELGRSSLKEVSSDINEITKKSEGILEVNAVMENIATQTNLLAMNAGIEAAHAGQSGRGFAVIAGEIRKLAESSSNQSKTISEVLKKIKESIDKISASTAAVLDKFMDIDTEVRIVSEQESNIRTAMEEQTAGSRQILEATGQLQGISLKVREGSENMLQGIQEVIMEGENLTTATNNITEGINEIAYGANNINSAIERVHSISEKNEEHIATLSVEVDRFKVERNNKE